MTTPNASRREPPDGRATTRVRSSHPANLLVSRIDIDGIAEATRPFKDAIVPAAEAVRSVPLCTAAYIRRSLWRPTPLERACMKPKGQISELDAVNTIFAAFSGLDSAAQDRVLRSVLALLGKEVPGAAGEPALAASSARTDGIPPPSRRKGLSELVSEKKPGTNPQRIALFAYYRDKVEMNPRFSRADLREYFAKAKQPPPTNYDRDFGVAVTKGWIHEDGEQSYITTKGIEIVENAFEGERSYTARPAERKSKKPGRRGR